MFPAHPMGCMQDPTLAAACMACPLTLPDISCCCADCLVLTAPLQAGMCRDMAINHMRLAHTDSGLVYAPRRKSLEYAGVGALVG